MLTTPVLMTWPRSSEVTRLIGTKIRRRPCTSTTRPMTRLDSPVIRTVATASRTRPTDSPFGSNTDSPANRARKTRVGVGPDMVYLPGFGAGRGRGRRIAGRILAVEAICRTAPL